MIEFNISGISLIKQGLINVKRNWRQRLTPTLQREMDRVAKRISDNIRQGRAGKGSGFPLKSRTGALADSFKGKVERTRGQSQLFGDLEGKIVSNSPYAEILERGGTIFPSRGQFLTVPYFGGGESSPIVGSKGKEVPLRNFMGQTFLRPSSQSSSHMKATWNVFYKGPGFEKEPKLIYFLAPSVTITARNYIQPVVWGSIPSVRRNLEQELLNTFGTEGFVIVR